MNLASIDLNLLVALEALLSEQSVTRAARRLGLSQPATSHALGRLRELLADPLLVRGPGGMTMTARARALEPGLRAALEAVRGVLSPAPRFEPATSTRRFSLATADQVSWWLLPPLLARLSREAPGVDLAVRAPLMTDADAVLERGEIDLSIGLFTGALPALHRRVLVREQFVGVLRRGHPASRGRLTLDRYCELPHLLVAPRGRPGSAVDDLLAGLGRRRRVALMVPHFLLAPQVIARSELIWTGPRTLVRAHAAFLPLELRPLPLEVAGFEMSLDWHERAHHDEGHRWLRELIVEVATAVQREARPARGAVRGRS